MRRTTGVHNCKNNPKLKSKWKVNCFSYQTTLAISIAGFLFPTAQSSCALTELHTYKNSFTICPAAIVTHRLYAWMYIRMCAFVLQTKTYVAKLMFPAKQMKFWKAGKLYHNEFNFEASAQTHAHTQREIYIYIIFVSLCVYKNVYLLFST